MDKHLWEGVHQYYCTEGGYTHTQASHQTIWEFKSLADFLDEMADCDMDYNLLFRCDWDETDSEGEGNTYTGDDNYRNGQLKLFFMHQRKGFHSCSIVDVCRADEPKVIEFLKPRLQYLVDLWSPLTLAE